MKRQRRKHSKPTHPWEKDRMDSEDKLLGRFGLRRKREIWRAETVLRNFRRQARKLQALSGPQAELETRQLLKRLQKLGLIGREATLDDVLGLKVESILGRYLQVVLQQKEMVKTPRQARQLILHGHVSVGGRRVDVPSYLVAVEEESMIKLKYRPPEAPKPVAAPSGPAAAQEAQPGNKPVEGEG